MFQCAYVTKDSHVLLSLRLWYKTHTEPTRIRYAPSAKLLAFHKPGRAGGITAVSSIDTQMERQEEGEADRRNVRGRPADRLMENTDREGIN